MMTDAIAGTTRCVARGGHSFAVPDRPETRDGVDSFLGEAEAPTLAFFDAVLPRCRRLIDCGASIGLMSLYGAGQAREVHAIEPSPTHRRLLRDTLAANPALAGRIRVHDCAIGARDDAALLFRTGIADAGASLFRTVERQGPVRGDPEAVVPVRAAPALLGEIGLDAQTLLKLDIEGAEYAVLSSLAGLLAEARPFLLVSFHPFNIVADDAYRTELARLRAALEVAEACACYPYMYLHEAGPAGWTRIDPPARLLFLRHFLLAEKSVDRVATPLLGFTGTVGFSNLPLPELDRLGC